ncbi:hypothetical protein JX265_006087 [Neoarthrinium moseri]|uniref:Rhodopsin domain-containing protein n=1 Tax=Neoarthrinium moseri TaxID=1658444 RepID=A0A9P9WN72_9PEZI|nr:uncharacterized protein JN550_004302 [Neoarthrinium moseri]KAI1855683.1 hypothetical protein JX266_000548 [Neoarthrinium moseri]KAI1871047.1 hypothetical protein JX265_006087 [Neoarthrinium moseri]KAI1872099.1 hypothetical protein JN550_004302 [Neoarthrinium moseri]
MNTIARDSDDDPVFTYISPWNELNAGLWSLFAGATVFLGLRLWCKIDRRHGLWYDDYILIVSWTILLANNILIVYEFATGYILEDSTQSWDDRMHILINVSSCGTLIGQALTKTAFAVTLLRLSNRWQQGVLWFCISTMNVWMVLKVIFQWAKVCGKSNYQDWYRLNFCIGPTFRADFKEGGNVYNVIMDFIFASFPWLITRSLEMRKVEKIGLCVTLSLGMVVAIVSAVRISWKDDGNERDPYYIWRNGVSQVWYSSEVTGTIMVQCIPILRTIIKEIHTSLVTKKLESTLTGDTRSMSFGSKRASAVSKRETTIGKRISASTYSDGSKKGADIIALREIPEEPDHSWQRLGSLSAVDTERAIQTFHFSDSWPLSNERSPALHSSHSGKSFDTDNDRRSHSFTATSEEKDLEDGLSPPPKRKTNHWAEQS